MEAERQRQLAESEEAKERQRQLKRIETERRNAAQLREAIAEQERVAAMRAANSIVPHALTVGTQTARSMLAAKRAVGGAIVEDADRADIVPTDVSMGRRPRTFRDANLTQASTATARRKGMADQIGEGKGVGNAAAGSRRKRTRARVR